MLEIDGGNQSKSLTLTTVLISRTRRILLGVSSVNCRSKNFSGSSQSN